MKTRIIVAVIFVPILFVVLFFLPAICLTVLIALLTTIGSYELIHTVNAKTPKRLYVYAGIVAAAIPFGVYFGARALVFHAALYILIAVPFFDAVLTHKTAHELTLREAAAAVFGGAVIPYFLACLISTRLLEGGRFLVLIPFLVAFITDGGAYFTGVFFGKVRPFPYVSPKKSIEGCIGGFATGVAAMAVYGVVLHFAAGLSVNFWAMALYGLIGAIVTEFGDLVFSLVKREFDIKDYGNLLPGHGGILDRFDSMVFAAPALYFLMHLWPAF